MSAEHTSDAPHEGQATDLWRELCLTGKQLAETKRQKDLAEALSESYRARVDSFESQWTALTRERDAALAERDRLRASEKMAIDDNHTLARERERLQRDLDAMSADWYAVRDAARAFLLVLGRTTFSAVALKGPELDALRRAAE